jgi:hypothetical protein
MIARRSDLGSPRRAEVAAAPLAAVPLAKPDIMVVDLTLPRGSGWN